MPNQTKVTRIEIYTEEFDTEGSPIIGTEVQFKLEVAKVNESSYQGVTSIFLSTNSVENILAKYYTNRNDVFVSPNSPLIDAQIAVEGEPINSDMIINYWQYLIDTPSQPIIILKCADSQPCTIDNYMG